MSLSIYRLTADIREADYLRYGRGMSSRATLCQADPEHTVSSIRSSPLRVEYRGVGLTDFLWTSYGEPVVGPDVVDAFEKVGITGCEFHQVILENTMGEELAGDLYELKCTGWTGMAPPESGVRVLRECPYCKHRVFSGYSDPKFLFDIDSWDGNDIFIIWPLPRYLFVTEAVKELLKEKQFTGAKAIPIAKLPKVMGGTLTPGNIRNWFDEKRATKLSMEIEKALRK